MLNIIKMDLRHMFGMKSFKVIMIVAVVLAFFVSFMNYMTASLLGTMSPEQMEAMTQTSSISVGVHSDIGNLMSTEEIDYMNDMHSTLTGGYYLVTVSIFAVIFTNQDIKSGFIKSISNRLSDRGRLMIAKIISLSVFVAIIFAIAHLATLAADNIFFKTVRYSGFADYLAFAVTELWLYIAFCALAAMITVVSRSSVLGVAISLVIATGITSLLYLLIDMCVGKLFDVSDFDFGKYMLYGNISGLSIGGDVAIAWVTGGVFLVLSALAGYFVLKKRDV